MRAFLPVVLVFSMASSSCWFRKSPPVFTPPPPQTQPQTTVPEPPTLPAPPKIEGGDPSATLPLVTATIPEAPGPTKPKPAPRTRGPATPPPKSTAPATPSPETPAPPRLAQIFTPDQLRAYNRALDESLDRVRKALAILGRKTLNAEQSEKVVQIRTFEKQAEQAREQDLVTAVSLARRADLLAQDLLDRVP